MTVTEYEPLVLALARHPRLRAHSLGAGTVTVKIRRHDFTTFTRQRRRESLGGAYDDVGHDGPAHAHDARALSLRAGKDPRHRGLLVDQYPQRLNHVAQSPSETRRVEARAVRGESGPQRARDVAVLEEFVFVQPTKVRLVKTPFSRTVDFVA